MGQCPPAGELATQTPWSGIGGCPSSAPRRFAGPGETSVQWALCEVDSGEPGVVGVRVLPNETDGASNRTPRTIGTTHSGARRSDDGAGTSGSAWSGVLINICPTVPMIE